MSRVGRAGNAALLGERSLRQPPPSPEGSARENDTGWLLAKLVSLWPSVRQSLYPAAFGHIAPWRGEASGTACALRRASGVSCGLRAAPEPAPPAGRRQDQLSANYFSPTDLICLWPSSRLPLCGLPLLPPVACGIPFHAHLRRPPLTTQDPWPVLFINS